MARFRDQLLADGGADFTTQCEEEETIMQCVLRSLSNVKGVPAGELDPLFESVEFDSVEDIVHHAEAHDSDVSVEFVVEECTVLVRSNGEVRVSAGVPETTPVDSER